MKNKLSNKTKKPKTSGNLSISNKRHVIVCPACKGKLVQKNKQGLKVICPACRGKGEVSIPDLAPEACDPINLITNVWNNAGGLIC